MKIKLSLITTVIAVVLIVSTLATVFSMGRSYPQNPGRTTLVCLILLICLFFFTWAITIKPASKKLSKQ